MSVHPAPWGLRRALSRYPVFRATGAGPLVGALGPVSLAGCVSVHLFICVYRAVHVGDIIYPYVYTLVGALSHVPGRAPCHGGIPRCIPAAHPVTGALLDAPRPRTMSRGHSSVHPGGAPCHGGSPRCTPAVHLYRPPIRRAHLLACRPASPIRCHHMHTHHAGSFLGAPVGCSVMVAYPSVHHNSVSTPRDISLYRRKIDACPSLWGYCTYLYRSIYAGLMHLSLSLCAGDGARGHGIMILPYAC